MGEQVRLTIIGRQRDGSGEINVTRTTAKGEYYYKNHSLYLLYRESADDDSAIIQSRIKYNNNRLELIRTGTVHTRMIFECGKEHMTDYVTPYGCLRLGILTHSVEGALPPHAQSSMDNAAPAKNYENLIIRAVYSLTAEGQTISDCEIEISIVFERK